MTSPHRETPTVQAGHPETLTPGPLRGSVVLEIQTRQAQRLMVGRKPTVAGKPMIPGLFYFASRVGALWTAAARDNPYADWWLIQLADSLQQARQFVQAELQATAERLRSVPGVNITVAHSVQPISIPLRFKTPYGFMGAYLIADYDALVCAVLSTRHLGLMTRDQAEQRLYRAARSIRRTFLIVTTWREVPVTRRDLREDTAVAREACERWGEPPTQVIEGSWRAVHAPAVRPPPAAGVKSGGH